MKWMHTKKWNTMEMRCRMALLVLLILSGGLVIRLYTLSTGADLQQAAAAQQSYVLQVGQTRGTIYDCQLRPITNGAYRQVTAAVASPAAVTAVRRYLPAEESAPILEQMQNGKPALFAGALPENTAGAVTLRIPRRYGSSFCAPHVIGYVDEQGEGVCGIEMDYNDILRTYGGAVQVRYRADAWGRTLNGEALTVSESGAPVGGVVLTIDRDLQQMAEAIAKEKLDAGAIIIMETATGKIRAMVSAPDYDVTEVENALTAENSPLLNRALCAYNVGSVFKLVSACCAVEQGQTALRMDCTGTMEFYGRSFQCIYGQPHGEVELSRAVAVSCNCYFIRLAEQLGAKTIYNMAERLGFGRKVILSSSIVSDSGRLPRLQDLSAPAALANFSFGQGDMMATPLQIAGMVQAIANSGIQIQPTLIEGMVDENGEYTPEPLAEHEQVMEEAAARQVKAMMIQAVQTGTAANAAPESGGAGAKTATAETGIYQEGEAVIQAWCAGFYPADTAEYTIVVFAENGRSGSGAAAPVFKQVADGIFSEQMNHE